MLSSILIQGTGASLAVGPVVLCTVVSLALGVAVLGGGAALLGVLTWHMLRLPPKDAQNAPGPDSSAGEKTDEKSEENSEKTSAGSPLDEADPADR